MKNKFGKKILILLTMAGMTMAVGTAMAANLPKTVALHNGKLITISCNAVAAHAAHGDKVRRCKKSKPKHK